MRRRLLVGLGLGVVMLLWSPVASLGDLGHDLSVQAQTADQLRAAIAAESKQIGATAEGLQAAQARLASLQTEANLRQSQLLAVQRSVVMARDRLTQLENRFHLATRALAANLVASYKDAPPDAMTVVLESNGFADALERLDFMEKVQRHNSTILVDTKTAHALVLAQAKRLDRLEIRDRALTAAIVTARNQAAAVQGALLTRQANQLQQRANTAAKLSAVRGRIASIKGQIARLAQPVATGTPVAGLPIDAGGMAQPPPGAPGAVRQVIAAGNAIAGLPYLYGGGHGSFHANAYDCSGSVSYALAAAGLVSSPLDSTAFESWGDPGPGRWITVYANAGHAWMVVAGWRFDTGALSQDGTRWSRAMRSTAGFVARHPPGL